VAGELSSPEKECQWQTGLWARELQDFAESAADDHLLVISHSPSAFMENRRAALGQ
jgi:hypothetical protein